MNLPRASRFAGLDTLRAVAILSVIGFHLNPFLPPAFTVFGNFGWMGVDLFFVLSGFLIGWQLMKPGTTLDRHGIAEFYVRRAYRILPAYLVAVLLYVFVPVWRERPGLAPAWKFLTFTYNLDLRFPSELAFSHSWSLCIEEHFYLVLPLAVLWMMRRPSLRKTAAVLVALMLAGVAVRWVELGHVRAAADDDELWRLFMTRIYYPTYSRVDGLLAGVALAAIRSFRPEWWRWLDRRGAATLAAGCAVAGLAFWTFHWDFPSPENPLGVVIGFPLIALAFALLVASATSSRSPLRFAVPGAELVATLAFSLYLTHKAIAHLCQHFLPEMHKQSWRAAAVYAVACLSGAAALHFGVERPFLRMRDRRLSPTAPAVPMDAALDPAI